MKTFASSVSQGLNDRSDEVRIDYDLIVLHLLGFGSRFRYVNAMSAWSRKADL